jgi:hypothetical protein
MDLERHEQPDIPYPSHRLLPGILPRDNLRFRRDFRRRDQWLDRYDREIANAKLVGILNRRLRPDQKPDPNLEL